MSLAEKLVLANVLLASAACSAVPASATAVEPLSGDEVSGGGNADVQLDRHVFSVDLDRLASASGVAADSFVREAGDWVITIDPVAMRSSYYQTELKPQLDALREPIRTGRDGPYYVAFPFSNARSKQLAVVRSIEPEDPDYAGVVIRLYLDGESDVRKALTAAHFRLDNLFSSSESLTITSNRSDVPLAQLENFDLGLDDLSMGVSADTVTDAELSGHFSADITLLPVAGEAHEQSIHQFTKRFVTIVGVPPLAIPVEWSATLDLGFGIFFAPSVDGTTPAGFQVHVDARFGPDGKSATVSMAPGSSIDSARTSIYTYAKVDVALFETVHAVAKLAIPALYIDGSGCGGLPRLAVGFHSGFGAGLGAGAFRHDWNIDGPGCTFFSNTGSDPWCSPTPTALLADLGARACP